MSANLRAGVPQSKGVIEATQTAEIQNYPLSIQEIVR
jgi:hypothetical protein